MTDHDVAPDDRWDFRGALIYAFWRRGVYTGSAGRISEKALLGRGARKPLLSVPGLDLATLRFNEECGRAASVQEPHRQVCQLGYFVTRPAHLAKFGLLSADDAELEGDEVRLPGVEPIRSARRSGPDGEIVFDLGAEVT